MAEHAFSGMNPPALSDFVIVLRMEITINMRQSEQHPLDQTQIKENTIMRIWIRRSFLCQVRTG
jgi:hypothetical protein